MSIEAYEELTNRFELYSQIKEGMDDIASGNTKPFSKPWLISESSQSMSYKVHITSTAEHDIASADYI